VQIWRLDYVNYKEITVGKAYKGLTTNNDKATSPRFLREAMERLPEGFEDQGHVLASMPKGNVMNIRITASIAAWVLLASIATVQTASAQPAKIETFIRSVIVDSNAGTLSITGTNFGDPVEDGVGVVGLATPGGFFLPVATANWTDTSITAVLPPRPPGNYKVIILKAPVNVQNQPEGKKDVMAITIEAPATEVPDQNCPSGTVAVGVTDGMLLCAFQVDNDTTYTPGFGMSLIGTNFSIDQGAFQRRVSVGCPPGSAIREIFSNGTVNCQEVTTP